MPGIDQEVSTGLEALAAMAEDAEFEVKVAAALHPQEEGMPAHPGTAESDSDPRNPSTGQAEDKPIQIKDEVRSTSWAEFEAAVLKAREVPVSTYVPPAPTARQQAQIDAEMEVGRKRVARAEEQKKLRPMPVPSPSDGYTTPVFRPGGLYAGGEHLPKR